MKTENLAVIIDASNGYLTFQFFDGMRESVRREDVKEIIEHYAYGTREVTYCSVSTTWLTFRVAERLLGICNAINAAKGVSHE